MTRKEAEVQMACFRQTFSSVRLLNEKAVLHAPQAHSKRTELECRVLHEKCQLTTLDVTPQRAEQIFARYIEVDGEPCVLELVQDLQQDTPEAVVQRRQMLTQTGSMGEKLYRDALTGLYNRRYYEDALKNRSMEAGVAVLDMDGFKACNETYGHQAGDKMLEAAVGVMRHCVRRSDTIIRYGGDEFLLLLPHIEEATFQQKLQDICCQISETRLPGLEDIRLSVSIGGLINRGEPIDCAVERANQLMMQAKKSRNAVVTDSEIAAEDIAPRKDTRPLRRVGSSRWAGILKLTNKDYNENGLSELLALFGSAYNVNIKIFNDLQHTITGWPGGKPNADDTYRPERAKPYPKRVVVFSPHPDDDVISMGGTIRRLVEQKHDVHVAYETSGNIAVGDEEVIRFLHFINGFNQIFNNSEDQVINDKYTEIRKYLKEKKDGDMDTRDILTIKGLIRRGEARTACTYNNIPLDHCHFLDLPFYETGKIQKNPISEADVEIVRNLLREVKPHQIFVAGDLADPHGTHRVCTDAVFAAIDLEKEEGAKWLKECRIWMYRGAWAEWEIENIEMAVPISPEELRAKRNSILKHQSQMESAPFLGNDERLFWQRSEDRNRGTAALYDSLGLASYEAMEAFVEYIPL